MSPDLKYLALTALLTASLWIPYIAAQYHEFAVA
jgi:hypothetical protein